MLPEQVAKKTHSLLGVDSGAKKIIGAGRLVSEDIMVGMTSLRTIRLAGT